MGGPHSWPAGAPAAAATRREFVRPFWAQNPPRIGAQRVDVCAGAHGWAGGGVAAERLSAAGYRVVVLEKAIYYRREEMTQIECNAMKNMYEKSPLLTTDDGHISILAGAT